MRARAIGTLVVGRRLSRKTIGRAFILPVIAVTTVAMSAAGRATASASSSFPATRQDMLDPAARTILRPAVDLRHALRSPIGMRPAIGLPPPTVGSIGFSVAVSGEFAIIGEPGLNNGAGAVLLYEHSGGSWHLQATVVDPRATSMDEFGWSVAISSSSAGSYAAVGATDANSTPDVVYVYVFAGGKWKLQAALPDPGASTQDNFGNAVAINSSTLVVGAMCVDKEQGKFYVYERFDQGWTLQASVSDPANSPKDWFGESLSVSGNNVLVGARDTAYVFSKTIKNHWHRTAIIRNPGSAKDSFGWDVALSDATAAIGAPGGVADTIIPGPLSSGATYMFALRGKTWWLRAKLRAPAGTAGDQFGYSVALDGRIMMIGMPLYGKTGCGRAFEFKFSGTKWVPRAQISDKQCNSKAELGFAVAAAGSSDAIGIPYCNALHGAVYLRKVS